MEKTLRELLNEKYNRLPEHKHDKERDERTIYLDYINVLNELLNEIKDLRQNNVCFLLKGFNRRQLGCIERCTKTDNGWKTELENFHQKYYEMTDFIYYPGFEYGSLSQEEFSVIEIIAVYLIYRAKENIKMLEE